MNLHVTEIAKKLKTFYSQLVLAGLPLLAFFTQSKGFKNYMLSQENFMKEKVHIILIPKVETGIQGKLHEGERSFTSGEFEGGKKHGSDILQYFDAKMMQE